MTTPLQPTGVRPINDDPEPFELIDDTSNKRFTDFRLELEKLINKYSMENGSDTPDYVLAQHLCECLATFNMTIRNRERYYQ